MTPSESPLRHENTQHRVGGHYLVHIVRFVLLVHFVRSTGDRNETKEMNEKNDINQMNGIDQLCRFPIPNFPFLYDIFTVNLCWTSMTPGEKFVDIQN